MLFSVTSQCMLIELQNFCFAKKHFKFYFKKRNHFRDGMTRLVINTRLFTTLKSVAMVIIIEFFDLCIPHFVVECTSKSFIMHSLENGFVQGTILVESTEDCEM